MPGGGVRSVTHRPRHRAGHAAPRRAAPAAAATGTSRLGTTAGVRVTRRGIQLALGLLWILDGALQLQPFMLGHGLATQVIAPAGHGQPWFVAAAVGWAAGLVAAHPAGWDSAFAAVQLLIGAALLARPLARAGLAACVGWAAGIWYLGEGLGGVASGHASLLAGAPGAALLYAVLALAAWPQPPFRDGPGLRGLTRMRADAPPAGWVPAAWAVLWTGSALLAALPGQGSAAGLAGEVAAGTAGAPAWLAHLDHALASALPGAGPTVVTTLVILEAGIGAAGLRPGRARRAAGWAGIAVSAA
ncbi:MAG: hypothetical protein ACRDPY_34820, partial [Streptosporangiaceae bacterium]